MKARVGDDGVVGDGMVRKAMHLDRGDLHGDKAVFMSAWGRAEEPAMQESEPQ